MTSNEWHAHCVLNLRKKKETKLLTHNYVFDRCSTSSPFNKCLAETCFGSHLRERTAATVHQFIAPMSMCMVPWAVWFLSGFDFLSCYPQVVSVGCFCKCIYGEKTTHSYFTFKVSGYQQWANIGDDIRNFFLCETELFVPKKKEQE